MEEKQILKVIDETGMEKEIEAIAYFTLALNNKDYLIYTDNNSFEETTENVRFYASEVINKEDDSIELANITDDAVWTEIKKFMIDLSKDGE